MFGAQYYNQIVRKYIIGFGNLFNDIVVQRLNSAGVRVQSIAVPIAYGPKEKFIVRLAQDSNLEKEVMEKIGLKTQINNNSICRLSNRNMDFAIFHIIQIF